MATTSERRQTFPTACYPKVVAAHTRFTAAVFLCIVLLWFKPVAALKAQSQDQPVGVETTLKDTDAVDVGKVISRGPAFVTVKNGRFTRVFWINRQTVIRRADSSPLQIGDEITVHSHIDSTGTAVADSIEANVGHWEGVITKVVEGTVYITFDAPVTGRAKVVVDKDTELRYCATDDQTRACTLADLKIGRHLDAIGFILKLSELRATRVLGIQEH